MDDPITTGKSLKHYKGVQLVAVIVMVFLVLVVPFAVYLISNETRVAPRAGGPVTGSETGPSGASLYLVILDDQGSAISSTQYLTGDTFDVEVYLSTGDHEVTAADIVVDYDTNLLETTEVVLGDFLPQELVASDIKTIGYLNIVKFTVGSDPENPRIGSGVIATLKMKAKNNTGNVLVSFNEGTQIAAVGSNSSVLSETQPLSISVTQATTTSLSTYFELQGLSDSVSSASAMVVDVNVMLRPPSLPGASPKPAVFKTAKAIRASDGYFDISLTDVPTELHEVFVKGPTHLRRLLDTVDIHPGYNSTSFDFEMGVPVVLNGDIIDNNTVDIFDYALVVEDFGPRMPTTGSIADLDLDGDVDIFDYSLVVENFGKAGD